MIHINKILVLLFLIILYCQSIFAYRTISQEGLKILTNVTKSESLKVIIDEYLKPILIPRVSDTDGNKKVQEFIKTKFKTLGWTIEEDTFKDNTPYGEKTFNNIIVTKNVNVTGRFVLAAHFDSKYFDPPNNFVGATDSAVPCAMLIDLAYRLDPYFGNREDTSTATTLQLIFFDGEEAFKTWTATDSLYGSRHLAEKWEKTYLQTTNFPESKSKKVIDSIETFVLLDLLGVKQPSFSNYYQTTSWLFSELAQVENRLYAQKIIKTESTDSYNSDPYFNINTLHTTQSHIEDDHLPFLQRGVPVLHIIPFPFPSVWHSNNDDLNSIDPDTVFNLNTIFRIFAAEYLGIDPNLSKNNHDELRIINLLSCSVSHHARKMNHTNKISDLTSKQ